MVEVMLAEIEFYSPYDVIVRGSYGIAEHLRTVKHGRGSVWLTLSRGFSVSEPTARDLICLLERRGGWDIVITNRERREPEADGLPQPEVDRRVDAQPVGLW